jgi:hypothetical protein
MTCSISSVIDDNIICSFRFVEDVFLGTCGRHIECEALHSLLVGGDHSRTLPVVNIGRRRVPPPPYVSSCLGLPASWTKSQEALGLPTSRTKSREASEHPCPDLVDDTMLLMLSAVFIVVVLSHGGKSFISRSVSSVDPCVIYSLVLLLTTKAKQTFTNLLVRLELCFGVLDHILMQYGCLFTD